jgi:hypothetical protein
MGYRFYTSKEFAALNRADDARRRKSLMSRFNYPVQEELNAVITKIPVEKQGFARAMVYMKKLSPKQIAAAERMILAAKAA